MSNGLSAKFPAEHATGGFKQSIAAHRIVDGTGKEQRADQRAHEVGDAIAVFGRIGAEAQRPAQPVEVLREAARIPGAGGAAQPGNIGADGHDHATGVPVIAMMMRQITVDQQPGAPRRSGLCRNAVEIRHGGLERSGASFRHELRFVPKMRIKTAMSEAGTPHHLIDPGFSDPALAKRFASRREDATAGGYLVGRRITH